MPYKWIISIASIYKQLKKNTRIYRCKIISVNVDKDNTNTLLQVLINGVKKQVVFFSPKELVNNDEMLNEFSVYDVRAITFYALQNNSYLEKNIAKYQIISQEYYEHKTIYSIKKLNEIYEERRSAIELYCDDNLLTHFSYKDIKNIISTAIQEQTLLDLNIMETS